MRAKNLPANVISVALKAVLKENTVTAYTECQAFNEDIKGKQKDLDVFVAECVGKYSNPDHVSYFNSLVALPDLKAVNNELTMLYAAIDCLKMKKELMTDTAKEAENLLNVLKDAL